MDTDPSSSSIPGETQPEALGLYKQEMEAASDKKKSQASKKRKQKASDDEYLHISADIDDKNRAPEDDKTVFVLHEGSASAEEKNRNEVRSMTDLKAILNDEKSLPEKIEKVSELKRSLEKAQEMEEQEAPPGPDESKLSRDSESKVSSPETNLPRKPRETMEERRVTFTQNHPEEEEAKDPEEKQSEPPEDEVEEIERPKTLVRQESTPSTRGVGVFSYTTTFGSMFKPKDQPVIFTKAPVIQSLEMSYSVDQFNVSHVSFVADLTYDEHHWQVLFHRQNLVEYHTNLKSKQMQTRLNPFTWGSKRQVPDVPESTFESAVVPPSPTNLSESKRNMHGSPQMRRARVYSTREIHFPRQLLSFDRHRFFHKNVDFQARSTEARQVLDEVKDAVQTYLTQILNNDVTRNLPITLELLRCSTMTFDNTLGPSVIEGWVKFQRHPPSMGAVKWHTCRTGCVVCSVGCLPISNSRRYKGWIVIKESFAAFLKRPTDTQPMYIVLFDSGFELLKGFSTTGRRKHMYLHSNTTMADLTFSSRNEKKRWAEHLKLEPTANSWHCKDHPHGSFAPEREDRCFARPLIDGQEYFATVADAIENASSEIYIGGWWVTPDIILKRDKPEEYDYWRMTEVLKRKAAEGIRVFILMYKEVEVALALNSKFQESRFGKTPNIYVLRHPNFTLGGQWYWSHHEKLVVIDGVKAYAGGLDLCWGRYDDDAHTLLDMDYPPRWPGLDYYNPRIRDIVDAKAVDKDILDRSSDPRMPWHDVSYAVSGPVARDIARHFIHQWNSAIESKSGSRYDLPLLVPRDYPAYPEPEDGFYKVKCQVLRSMPEWSGGQEGNPERSIQDAYLAAIAEAQKFIFIENQFFVSGVQGDGLIQNRIADALYVRIVRAAMNKEPFKVVVFLPLLPSFEGAVDNGQTALRHVLYWQYRSICRESNRRSLLQMLEDHPDIGDPFKYISFFGLRTFDKNQVSKFAGNGAKDNVFTEMVYIHSKVMVIDDQVAFIGSCNINDRSMTGKRDSELCVKFTDITFNKNAQLGGAPWKHSGSFAHGLRMRLFEEHFGQYLPTDVLDDFVLDENFERLKALAKSNTEIYEKVFALVPSDRILTFADLRRSGNAGDRPAVVLDDNDAARRRAEEDEEFEDSISMPSPHPETTATRTITASNGPNAPMVEVRLQRLDSFATIRANGDGDSGGLTLNQRLDLLNGVYGHAVEFPLKFLSRAKKLKPNNGLVSDVIFT